jgi:4Fe-4S ferredoxin
LPLKTIKKDTAESLSLEWVLHIKDYKLTLKKEACVGCQICTLACPKEAVRLKKHPKAQGERARKAEVDIDLAKCNFCGICDVSCPYGAITVTSDGNHILSVLEKQSFPQLVRDIKVDSNKFPFDRKKGEDVCPLKLIRVEFLAADAKKVEDVSSLSDPEKQALKVVVNVEKDRCPCCGMCEVKLPDGAMYVHKLLSGRLSINADKCPEGCTDCMDVCPITGALYLSDSDRKVHVNEIFCVYCGACKVVCPVEEALELKRTHVNHTPVRSGAWNKALERLTSPTEMSKELKTKGSLKAMESVKKRVGLKREKRA